MIIGTQITEAENKALVNSFWLLDEANKQARYLVAVAGYADDQLVPLQELGKFEYREIPLKHKEVVRVEGGQHLNVNVLSRETLEDAVANPENIRNLLSACRVMRCASIPSRQSSSGTLSPVLSSKICNLRASCVQGAFGPFY